ncbi:uncharacterized protein SAPINGB_P006256 [Magnusiomyces paraingens]|uniref:non-specific serine/threonine protein kinase n=1 Tax=Magnusiomyces paraingens TaxID=2606893 RepID=A0A5E8C566_9ASCO|nr:uncharacterized protein SAPINGB_P006256 [Saprochaete ingens]VVT58532.1 unnamed protein product [Saprochaete ingens]
MALTYFADFWYSLESCLTCFQSPTLKINRRNFKIVKLLGEGGFSYVYLVQASSGELYAMKKIRCPFGQESVRNALREIEAYKLFDSPHIIKAIDSTVVQEPDGSKTVYIILPYFPRGNLQDIIDSNLVNGNHIPEPELLTLFLGVCQGVRAMHKHVMKNGGARVSGSRPNLETRPYDTNSSEQQLLEARSSFVLDDEISVMTGGDDEDDDINMDLEEDLNSTALGTVVPYAHRDIKPANVMLDAAGQPVLMDLGSTARARVSLPTRQSALQLQDLAAELCTLPYRAPELFYVTTDSTIDERVDVWSLGCTLFALMYQSSPFELQAAESGASLNMAISSGEFKFPNTPAYSEELKEVVRKCLTVDPKQRPYIDEIITRVENLIHS